MADESKKKAYYDSLIRAGVVPPEVSYDAFNLKIRDTNFAKIVYSGLKTASELGIVKDIPSEQQFNSVLQSGEFPTKPEIYKTNQPLPNVGATQTNQTQQTTPTTTTETEVVAEEETPQQGTPARRMSPIPQALVQRVQPQTNQPQPTPEETQIAPIDQQAGQVQGGRPISGDVLANAPKQQFQWSGQAPTKPVVQPVQQNINTMAPEQSMSSGNSYADVLSNAAQRGFNRGEIASILISDKQLGREEYAKVAELTRKNDKLATSEYMQKFASDPDLSSTLLALPEIAVESIASLYRHGLSRMATGAVAGGAAGSVVPIAGTLTGAGTGILAGMTVAGFGLELSSTILETLKEFNIDTKDERALEMAFKSPALMDYAKTKAYQRGIPIAIFDAFSMGIAGTLLRKPVSSAVSRGLRILGEAGIQGALGATGEATAQLVSGQDFKPYEILAEGLAEIPGSVPEVAIAVMSKNKSTGGNTKTDAARLVANNPDISGEVVSEMVDIGVGSGEITAQQADEIKSDVIKAQEIDAKIPAEIKDTELRVAAIGLIEERDNLNAQLETVDEAFKPAIQEKIKGINEQLQELSQIPQQQGTQAFFETNQPSQTNPLLRLPESVDAVMDKIDQGILVSAESLFDVYNSVQTAIRETLANRAITPEERSATINILSGMLTDIDRANTEGQRFVEQVEEVSVQDRVPAVREGVKPLPQGQAPKSTATPSISQAKAIREENRRKQAGTTTLPSSGQTIITPAPATTEVATEAVAETPTGTTAEAEVTTTPQAGSVGGRNKKRITKIEGVKNNFNNNAQVLIGALNEYGENVVGWKETDGSKISGITDSGKGKVEKLGKGVEVEFYNPSTKTTSKYFVEGDADKIIPFIENFVKERQTTTEAQTTTPQTPVAGAEAMTTETILDKETDLKGNEKDEFMFPVTYTESKRVGDEVEFVNSQGEQMTGNYRGTNNKGEAIIDSPTSKDGKKFNTTFVVPEDKVTFPKYVDTGIGKGDPDAIQYAIENNLFTDAIAQGRMSANDAKTIIESAGLKVPVEIEKLLTPTQDAVQKQTASQVPVQSGTTSSQEVAKGEPKAEPQSTADKGQAKATATQEEVGATPAVEVDKAKIITEHLPKGGELKGVTEINVLENGEEVTYGTKTRKTTITVKGLSAKDIRQELKFEKELLERSKKDASNFNESEIRSAKGLTNKEKEDAIKMHNQSLLNNEQVEKIVIPFYEKHLEIAEQATTQTTPTAETTTTTTEVTLNTPNETTIKDIEKIENATEKGRELALSKPVNKWVKRAFDSFQDLSSRAKKAGIYDGTTLKIGGKEYTVDTPAKFKAFLAQSQANFDAINEAVDKSEIDVLKAERDTLIQEFIKGMGKATMNLNPQQVSILAQLAWKNLQIVAKESKLSSAAVASLIKRKVDDAIAELNQMLTQSGQNTINPDKEDYTNIVNIIRQLAEEIATTSTSTAGQIGTAGQPSATQSPIYTKEQEELAIEMERKMDEGKPFIARSEPFWTAVKRKVAELRQKLDSPRELLNFAEKMIGTTPGTSYKRTRELPLGRAMEQLRGKARNLASPYMERISDALKPIEKHLPDFEKYLIYRRIIDRNQQDKLNQEAYRQGLLKDKPKRRITGGMTETQADILLNKLANKVGPNVFNQFIDAGDNLQVIFDDNLKDLVNAGVLTQDRYNAIKSQNEFYVPFDVVQRDFRGNVITGTEYDRSTAQNQSVIKRIEGMPVPENAAKADEFIGVVYKMMEKGEIDADSYYYLATNKITDARNAGNITQQEYENLMDLLSEPGLELHSPLNKTLNIINASQYQVARQGYMKDIDMLVDADTNNDYFVRLENKDKLPSGMSVITYYKDGVQQRVAVDEKLKQAIDTMTSPELNAFEKFLKSGSFLFKIAATSASISFLPVNFVIDLTRSLTSKAGLGSGATVTERAASVVQIPVIYSEALVNAIIGNLLNTKLGNALKLKSITPNFMYNQYEDWKKSPSYSEGSYLGHLVDRLKSGRTKSEIEDAKFLETVQRRTNTILGNPKTAKAIANAVLGTKQKTRMTVDGVMDIVNLISKMLENSHKIYGYTKLSGTETGVRKGIDRYIGGYIDKLHGRKKLTQAELENALDEVTDEVLNNIGSPNFEQIPPNMRAASIIVPFLGAAVKGNMSDVSRVLNSVNAGASKKERLDALAFTARNGAVFLIPAFITGLTMALKDDDDESKKMYDDMDENSKWSNSIIPVERNVDGEEGQFDFITIPIRGVPVIFNSIGRASGQAFGMSMKERLTKEELKKISKDVLLSSFSSMMAFNLADKTYLSDIDPETGERKKTRKEEELLNRSMSFASGLNPVIKYLPERWANKNFFGKYSIEPENIRGKRLRNAILNEVIDPETGKPISPSLLKNKFTPDYAVTLSKYFERNGIRMSPMIIDHLFDTFLAGAPEKFDVGASELMKRRFLWKERKLAYGEKPKN